jgi:ABC-type spermidine/putrescine transport system permease subunit I
MTRWVLSSGQFTFAMLVGCPAVFTIAYLLQPNGAARAWIAGAATAGWLLIASIGHLVRLHAEKRIRGAPAVPDRPRRN